MPPMLSRRRFLAGSAAALAVLASPRAGGAQGTLVTKRSRLVMLATGGGPRPRKDRGNTAHALVVDNVLYLVDCGSGVARQLVLAGIPLATLRHVFITHHHSDHNLDYGNVLVQAWVSGLRTRVDAWGPPPLEKMTRLYFEMNAYDIDTRIADEGRPPLVPLVHAHEGPREAWSCRTSASRSPPRWWTILLSSRPSRSASTVRIGRSSSPATRTSPTTSCGWQRAPTCSCTRRSGCRPSIGWWRASRTRRRSRSTSSTATRRSRTSGASPPPPASRRSCSLTWCPPTIRC